MTALLFALGVSGLIGCYDVATRMDRRTQHGVRAGVIVIGLGCIACMAGWRDGALILVLVGMGLFRAFDKRLWPRERKS